MVPEVIEFRDYLPATSSGKVDRKKLNDEMIRTGARITGMDTQNAPVGHPVNEGLL